MYINRVKLEYMLNIFDKIKYKYIFKRKNI